ncbi:hypothetical protein CEXT_775741 [Caerostris extrusa]|uniref:Uncharacterized protein n=1 Tax=Caerostris extrusa TaxID=172846 RepID=A0AAV4Q849_CAEEX|nr:hypothetical protein CEXT_775741 [Caerostris extrusa]
MKPINLIPIKTQNSINYLPKTRRKKKTGEKKEKKKERKLEKFSFSEKNPRIIFAANPFFGQPGLDSCKAPFTILPNNPWTLYRAEEDVMGEKHQGYHSERGRPPLRPGPLLRRGEAGASLLLHDRGHPDPQVEARGALPSRGVSPVEGRSPGSLPLLPAVRTRTLVPLPAAAAALPGKAPGRQPLAALCR